jgi:hypothetical protein
MSGWRRISRNTRRNRTPACDLLFTESLAETTCFLRKGSAQIDNNIVERALKKAILKRKNALFSKTPNGAGVGDLFMSLIHT